MYNIYYLNFNNRFNRKVKRYDIIESYERYIVGSSQKENFKWNDEMRTTITANIDEVPNYCLVCDENNIIVSRWFVIDGMYNRGNQYTLTLERDTIADYYWQLMNLPMYVQRGTIRDINDPSIYIKQGNFNQIKKKEMPLKDQTRIPWIVGYINKETPEKTITSQFAYTPEEATYTVSNISNWEYYNKEYYEFVSGLTGAKITAVDPTYQERSASRQNVSIDTSVILAQENITGGTAVSALPYPWNETLRVVWNTSGFKARERVVQFIFAKLANDSTLQNYIKNIMDVEYIPETFIANYNGKTIYDESSQIMYRIVITKDENLEYKTVNSNETIAAYINSKLNRSSIIGGQGLVDTYTHTGEFNVYRVSLQQIFQSMKTTLTDGRNHLEDAPYDMFCIPYGKIGIRYGNIAERFDSNKDVAMAMATAISEQLGDNCFDIQLLPYFPCQEILRNSDTDMRITRTKFNLITDDVGNPLSAVIWARRSQFNFQITQFSDARIPYPTSVQAKKIGHETQMFRLCSPNYSAAFDFSPYANNGCLAFEVSCVYKPFSPYIHINPLFNNDGLYGGNYNDARGLICSGDFSLTQMRDAWVNYELQNKNYQQIFNRQIESMELQQEIGKKQDVVSTVVGTVQGGATGTMVGLQAGGGVGMAIGGVAGALASGIGGAYDVSMNDQLRRDQLDAAKDNFAFNLANIKALPDTLTKVSAYNQQNKIFPFVEMYDALDEEKEAFKEQLKYQGMVINRVGALSDFIDFDNETFFQAILIRGDDAWENHTTNFIADQLARGIYIGGNE